jgi:hypothetical protein
VRNVLTSIGLDTELVGRSFALLAGVDKYPNMPASLQSLVPAGKDIEKLAKFLVEDEVFEEIVILRNEDVNETNLKYFLQGYFPEVIASQTPSTGPQAGTVGGDPRARTRFLFAYSGHGWSEHSDGAAGKSYLVQSHAEKIRARSTSIDTGVLRSWLRDVLNASYHSLALINACEAAGFINAAFGDDETVPMHPGAHAMTAGGTGEKTYALADLGPGSVFFEVILDGLGHGDSMRAGAMPADYSKGGFVTWPEFQNYVIQNVTTWSGQAQNPKTGDIWPDRLRGSKGCFYWINRNAGRPSHTREPGGAPDDFMVAPVVERLAYPRPAVWMYGIPGLAHHHSGRHGTGYVYEGLAIGAAVGALIATSRYTGKRDDYVEVRSRERFDDAVSARDLAALSQIVVVTVFAASAVDALLRKPREFGYSLRAERRSSAVALMADFVF